MTSNPTHEEHPVTDIPTPSTPFGLEVPSYEVNGADHPHRGWSRAFTPDRITRKVRIPEARS